MSSSALIGKMEKDWKMGGAILGPSSFILKMVFTAPLDNFTNIELATWICFAFSGSFHNL